MSRFHLARGFAREFGLPPHAYQIALRVERARALLARGLRAVDVAAAVGFADQSHFARHFTRAVGVTPGRYARAR
jgi:AraC-like DNA-binding protein